MNEKGKDTTGDKTSLWKTIVVYLKDTKEVITALSAIAAALFFAINYFASQTELNCLKIESARNDELVQTILEINELSAIWQLESSVLDKLNNKRGRAFRKNEPFSDDDSNDFFKAKSQLDNRESELNAARGRRSVLETENVECK